MAKVGRKPVPPERQRKHPITCRVTDAELAIIDERRGKMTRGEWLRTAALKKPPAIVPELNTEAWAYIGKMGNGIRFLVDQTKAGKTDPTWGKWLEQWAALFPKLRGMLLGLQK